MSQLKEKGLPSSDLQRKALLYPLTEIKEEYADTVIEGTTEALRFGRQKTFNELKKAGYLKVKKAKGKIPKLPVTPILEVEFSDFSPALSKIIKDKTFIASERTMDRIIGDIMENLKGSYEQGLGIDDAADRLNEVITSMEDYELERIARTEINGAQNTGAYFTIAELQIEYKQWWSALDSRVRDEHSNLHGEVVRADEPFSNGLMYPGDTSGPIESWINCRCRIVPYIPGLEEIIAQTPYYP